MDHGKDALDQFLVTLHLFHARAVELAQPFAPKARPAQLAPHEHIIRDGQGGRHGECLIDGLDPFFPRVGG